MDVHWRLVPFLAPVFAAVTAPAIQAIGAIMARAALGAPVAEIECPHCHRVIAVWAGMTRLLYAAQGDRLLGPPLSTDWQANVDIRCPRCGKGWHASGRAVGRNLHNGRPPLA